MLIFYHKLINRIKNTPAKKNKAIIITTAIAAILNLLIWLLIYFKLRPQVYNLPEDQAFIPLHYNIYIGIDSYGIWQKIFILPGLGLLFAIINTIIAFLIYNKKKILSYFLCLANPIIQLILLLSTTLIILINL